MSKRVYLSVVAAAVAATFSGQAGAAFSVINGAGASAVSNSLTNILLGTYCAAGATNVTYYDNDTNNAAKGSVYRIQCNRSTTTVTTFANNPDISYDTSGGSWKGLTSFSPALFTAAQTGTGSTFPVATVTIGAAPCATAVTKNLTIENVVYTVSYVGSCATTALTAAPQFGLTDVDAQLFNDPENQPLQTNTWNTAPVALVSSFTQGTELAGWPVSVFGMTFGVAASGALYTAMQNDQIAAGLIPATCAGLIETSSANTGCAPNIGRAQYRSIITNTVNSLNTNIATLFTTKVPGVGGVAGNTNITVARRDRGSGTQATSNAFFLGAGCTTAATEPQDLAAALPLDSFAPGYTVQYNFTTGGVKSALQSTSTNVIGVISADNEGGFSPGGFLRLDGVYPSNVNAANGKYDLWTQEQLHCQSGITGDALTFCGDLAGKNSTTVSAKAYVGPGTINLTAATVYPVTQVASGPTAGGVASSWFHQENALGVVNFCGGRYSR